VKKGTKSRKRRRWIWNFLDNGKAVF